jgi:hypothetical protein
MSLTLNLLRLGFLRRFSRFLCVLEGYKLEALDVFLTVVELLGLPIV